MARMVDANALLRKICGDSCGCEPDECGYLDEYRKERCKAGQHVANAPTVGGWVSVNDRLPDEEDYRSCHENWDGCVIWTNGSDIGLGWYYTSTGNWADIYDCRIDDVTHWMPLPKLPKEDD